VARERWRDGQSVFQKQRWWSGSGERAVVLERRWWQSVAEHGGRDVARERWRGGREVVREKRWWVAECGGSVKRILHRNPGMVQCRVSAEPAMEVVAKQGAGHGRHSRVPDRPCVTYSWKCRRCRVG
jgi:hypothetical protein